MEKRAVAVAVVDSGMRPWLVWMIGHVRVTCAYTSPSALHMHKHKSMQVVSRATATSLRPTAACSASVGLRELLHGLHPPGAHKEHRRNSRHSAQQ